MDKWDCFKNRPRVFFFLFYNLIFIHFFKGETIVRGSASSFGHSDPDPSSVIKVVFVEICRKVSFSKIKCFWKRVFTNTVQCKYQKLYHIPLIFPYQIGPLFHRYSNLWWNVIPWWAQTRVSLMSQLPQPHVTNFLPYNEFIICFHESWIFYSSWWKKITVCNIGI